MGMQCGAWWRVFNRWVAMEGVVLVELQSGALHFTKSTSVRFDSLHPKSERLNLGSLMFALQNFAGIISSTGTRCRVPPLMRL